ncbi:MAG: GNAT family N-acetyltransferase [Deltaproteobacteria bacterium]|nr:MAG: GNAT family N-acetyltransferase [Deltaproteobacteria bacterium]
MAAVDAAAWDALDHGPSPFLEHGFLRALEDSGSIGADTGWIPRYVLAETEPGRLAGAVATFVKLHGYGEYIFDFAWARAAERAGIPYFPKLVVAAPVTPATGRRLLVHPDVSDEEAVVHALVHGVREVADLVGCHSIHWLFCTEAEQQALARMGYAARASYQFHWHNAGYASFDDFLARLSSRKRKQFRKERRRAAEAVDAIDWVAGGALTDADVAAMDALYRRNVARHWGQAYLRPGFFDRLRAYLPHRVQFVRARRGARTIAGAIYLETERALYGRYWGSTVDVDCLHFELAAYQGIERCIARRIPLFEAGAQGEHKLLRGFAPSPTFSAHWLRHPELDRAVRAFIAREAQEVAAQMRAYATYLPYRRD